MFTLAIDTANAVLNAIVAEADAGASAAKIKIYDGVPPVSARVAPSGSLNLATLTCTDPVGTVANGVLTFGTISADASAEFAGEATFFRLTDSDDKVIAQGSVSDTAGSGDLKLSTTTVVAGGAVSVTSATLSV